MYMVIVMPNSLTIFVNSNIMVIYSVIKMKTIWKNIEVTDTETYRQHLLPPATHILKGVTC